MKWRREACGGHPAGVAGWRVGYVMVYDPVWVATWSASSVDAHCGSGVPVRALVCAQARRGLLIAQ